MNDLKHIEKKVENGERLTRDDGVALYASDDLFTIGRLANTVRERKNGNAAYYIVNHHINYSNVCRNQCRFCAFSRRDGEDGAYRMPLDEIYERADRAAEAGATELHIVGGCHPDLPYDYYRTMIAELHRHHPKIHLQAFTCVEIASLAEMSGRSAKEVLQDLQDAGLGSLPGGGAEIFADRVRHDLCPEKLPSQGWLDVARQAHELGIRTNATMLYGHIETPEERIDHMIRLREVQDGTGGFMSFIPLAFHPENTALSDLPGTTGLLDLKTMAIGRLMLDNFDHMKSFWIMLGVKLTQISLSFGADDVNGTVIEERITHAAGAKTPQRLTVEDMTRLILDAGREPVERNTIYQRIVREGVEWWIAK
ncbi:MAG: aminofutalosine synthase MqnE [Planctomycetes bacterium]|nr:aminofutalosine synthase MqnE [Planctomycetota bacterium]